jgi:hypothetical protein
MCWQQLQVPYKEAGLASLSVDELALEGEAKLKVADQLCVTVSLNSSIAKGDTCIDSSKPCITQP